MNYLLFDLPIYPPLMGLLPQKARRQLTQRYLYHVVLPKASQLRLIRIGVNISQHPLIEILTMFWITGHYNAFHAQCGCRLHYHIVWGLKLKLTLKMNNQDAVWCSSATFYKVYIVKGHMLSLLFICLVLAGKSFDKNKIRQQQDFKYDVLPPFWQQGRGQKTNKGKPSLHAL